MRWLLLTALVLSSCKHLCYPNRYLNIGTYLVTKSVTTPAGFQIDPSGISLSPEFLAALDTRLLAIERCMIETDSRVGSLDRQCFAIKFVPQTHHSPCSPDEEFLDIPAPESLCLGKGLKPTPECPCMWRSAVHNQSHLVVPYTADVGRLNLWDTVRIHTGLNNFWITPFAKCGGL